MTTTELSSAPVGAERPLPRGWHVQLDGNPQLLVPTERQRKAGVKIPRSGAEAWELYAQAMGITSTVHPYDASPVYDE